MVDLSYLWLCLVGLGGYISFRTVYRLYFHPLARIPGPKLTAASHLYEFFYNVIRPGQFIFQIEKMHEQYGPIVRINPREIHVIDPAFYHDIYAGGIRRREKDIKFIPTYGVTQSMASTVDHDLHRFRRGMMEDLLSKRSVLERSAMVEERVLKLMQRFEEADNDASVLSLDDAFVAMTSDIITLYASGKHWGFLEDKQFRNHIREGIADMANLTHIHRFFPWLIYIPKVIPMRLFATLLPGKADMFLFLDNLFEHSFAQMRDNGSSAEKDDGVPSENMINVLTHPSIPPEERTRSRLQDELTVFVGAGTETTSRTLTVAAYHIAKDDVIRDTLRKELKQLLVTPTSTSTWAELESLPYLGAVVNESLRLSYGIVGRLPRVAPTEQLRYKDYIIPPGTPMSSSSFFINRDASLFPEPDKFDPERWMLPAAERNHLKKYVVSFNKGSRSCIGINLAYMELFLTIAYMVRRFDMQLYNTGPEDIRIVQDMLLGLTRQGNMKVFAKISLVKE